MLLTASSCPNLLKVATGTSARFCLNAMNGKFRKIDTQIHGNTGMYYRATNKNVYKETVYKCFEYVQIIL
jgi:hypothetical protein